MQHCRYITFSILFSALLCLIHATDYQPWSQQPPGGLSVEQVPMFVTISWDDNARSGDGALDTGSYYTSMRWILEFMRDRKNPPGLGNAATYDGSPARASFYNNSTYMSAGAVDAPNLVKKIYHEAWVDGHEVANHTHSHGHGGNFSVDRWIQEIQLCEDWHLKPVPGPLVGPHDMTPNQGAGIPEADFVGFRAPFLEYNDNMFTALRALGYLYDTSIEEGYQYDQDGTNFAWPYTMDYGSPGHDVFVGWGDRDPVGNHPGLWQFPIHCQIVPDDASVANYGLDYSLRQAMSERVSWDWNTESGKVTGFDYNKFVQFSMNEDEVLAVLKHTLHRRLQGNRAPLNLGAHTQYYHRTYSGFRNTDYRKAMEVWEKFIDYALTIPEVRLVTARDVIEWCRNPVALEDLQNRVIVSILPDSIPVYQDVDIPDWDENATYGKDDEVVCNNHIWFSSSWYIAPGEHPGDYEGWIDMGPTGGYKVTRAGTVDHEGTHLFPTGSDVSFNFTPHSGYSVAQVLVNGEEISPTQQYSISSINENYSIAVRFSSGETNVVAASPTISQRDIRISTISRERLSVTVPQQGVWQIGLYNANGRSIGSVSQRLRAGENVVDLPQNISSQLVLLRIQGPQNTTKQMRLMIP
ncbi:chitin deacetylase [Chitinispirillum alkaliphilum]|nr:chitin deacetylase [Chitinispirillum alkaliphilum]